MYQLIISEPIELAMWSNPIISSSNFQFLFQNNYFQKIFTLNRVLKNQDYKLIQVNDSRECLTTVNIIMWSNSRNTNEYGWTLMSHQGSIAKTWVVLVNMNVKSTVDIEIRSRRISSHMFVFMNQFCLCWWKFLLWHAPNPSISWFSISFI